MSAGQVSKPCFLATSSCAPFPAAVAVLGHKRLLLTSAAMTALSPQETFEENLYEDVD